MFDAYPAYEHLLASAQLALAMLGMGALLAPRDFMGVVRAPKALGVGLAVQLAAIPLVAAALGHLLPVPVGIAAGLVLVAAVPGGTMSNVFTHFARGNIALSISLTAVTTVGALATTPALLRLLVGGHLPADFSMPTGRIALEIGGVLLLPLAIGMAVGHRFSAAAPAFSRNCIRGSLFVIALMVVGAAGAGRLDPTAYGWAGPLAVAGACALFQIVSLSACRLGGLTAADTTAVAIEATVRNTNLAVLVKAALIPATTGGALGELGDALFFVALLYGGVALPVSTGLIYLGRRKAPRPA